MLGAPFVVFGVCCLRAFSLFVEVFVVLVCGVCRVCRFGVLVGSPAVVVSVAGVSVALVGPSRFQVGEVCSWLRASRRRARSSCRFPLAPLSLFRPFVPRAVGSASFLSSSAFLSGVASGVCPVALVLRVFRWPVRSAVFLVLLRVSASPAVLLSVPRSLLVSFCRVALSSLGFSGPCSFARVACFLSSFPAPALVPSFSGVCSPRSVAGAFSSVALCLSRLLARGRACPSGCRAALAALVLSVARFLCP